MTDPLLTIEDATREFRVSAKTIRRRLGSGAIEGAYKRTGARGPEWVIPRSSLVAAGFQQRPHVEPSEIPEDPEEQVEYWEERALAAEAALAAGRGAEGGPSGRPVRFAGLGRFFVLAALVLALIAAVLAVSGDGGGEDTTTGSTDAVTAALVELTDPGDRLGIVGTVSAQFLPDDRVPVRIGPEEITDRRPRYVVAVTREGADEGDRDVATTLAERWSTVLAVERPSGVVRVFDRRDRGVGASDRADGDEAGPVETTAPGVTAGPDTSSPDTTTAPASTAAPATTGEDDAVSEGEGSARGGDGDPEANGEPQVGVDDERDASLSEPVTVEVVEGDNFWDLAEARLTAEAEQPPSDAEVAQYWQQVIDANGDRLVEPGNPDLLHVGQHVVLPAVT